MARKKLVIVALAIALGAALIYGWVERNRRSSAAEVEAQRALKQLGAIVIMDGNQQHVHSVDLRLAGVADKIDEALRWVDKLPWIAVLQISGTSVTNQQLRLIAGCRSLSILGMSQTSIGDEGIANVTGLSNLQRLFLSETKITSEGLKQIGVLRRLEILDLSKTEITGDLAPLANLDKVQHLVLSGVALGPGAIKTIAQMDSLRRLTIAGSDVEDEAMDELRAAKPGISIDQ